MNINSRLQSVFAYLPPCVLEAVRLVPQSELRQLRVIRLRLARKLTVTAGDKEYFLSRSGLLKSSADNAVDVTCDDISYICRLAFKESVHSFRSEIINGYVTVKGGSRIGFCGTAVLDVRNSCSVENVKDISCVNIRIAREIKGCADELCKQLFDRRTTSLLIAGPPASGKTTLLRDLTRQLGNAYSTSLIDIRNEIAAVFEGIAQNDVGLMTDIFTGYNRFEGIMTAIRVMSPVYLVCDEIGSDDDLKALEYAVNSGVKLIASCHCSDLAELDSKPVIRRLIKRGAFEKALLLGSGAQCGQIKFICDLSKHGKEKLRC